MSPHLDEDSENDTESVSSVGNYSQDEASYATDFSEKPVTQCFDEEELFGCQTRKKITRGLSKESLRIEVPDYYRRFTDNGAGIRSYANKNIATPSSCGQFRERVQPHNFQVKDCPLSLV